MSRRANRTIRQKYLDALESRPGKNVGDWRTDPKLIGNGVCPYCGRKTSANSTYCTKCVKEGFDEVHKMFGKTNGWNQRPIRVTVIRNGWRGRAVSGARSQSVRI